MFLNKLRRNQVTIISQVYVYKLPSFYEPKDKRVQSVLLSMVPITSRSNRCGIVFYFMYVFWCVDIRRPERKRRATRESD